MAYTGVRERQVVSHTDRVYPSGSNVTWSPIYGPTTYRSHCTSTSIRDKSVVLRASCHKRHHQIGRWRTKKWRNKSGKITQNSPRQRPNCPHFFVIIWPLSRAPQIHHNFLTDNPLNMTPQTHSLHYLLSESLSEGEVRFRLWLRHLKPPFKEGQRGLQWRSHVVENYIKSRDQLDYHGHLITWSSHNVTPSESIMTSPSSLSNSDSDSVIVTGP